MRREFAAAMLLLALAAAQAHAAEPGAEWKDADAPPPPALRTDGLIPLEVPGSSLRYGVDPASVAVTGDGIVRYVVVATSAAGAVNGLYEAIHCSTGEVKVYARYLPGSGWSPARDEPWRPLDQVRSHHSLQIARTGACIAHGTNGTAAKVVRDLGASVDRRFGE